MRSRRILHAMGAVVIATGGLLVGAGGPAAAEPCPDAEVVFARGTAEPPGVGGVGQAFVDSVRAQAGGKNVGVYPVNYAASGNFDDRMEIARTVVDGIRDERDRVQFMATNCPDTKLILGGYSQGAALTGFVTAPNVPPGVPAGLVPAPLTPDLADHVAAVVLFGKPSGAFLQHYDVPALEIGPLFADKTLSLCAAGDTVCEAVPVGGPSLPHALYAVNGMVGEGASFAASRI
ncbi:cutinase family protein [Mycobacterium sp. ACS4331]|uniref:cutinase family protein n=1 Tax=Mycobacterium sp. ACS4331 TaxID=1834121 RepID=UPI000AA7B8A6|nr:cutinase family protein [Mycobacterium sp. ACS4331]